MRPLEWVKSKKKSNLGLEKVGMRIGATPVFCSHKVSKEGGDLDDRR